MERRRVPCSTPVEVNATTIAAQPNDVEISDIVYEQQAVLRRVRYTHANLPSNHLLKQWQYEGIWLKATDKWEGNSWIVMMHNEYSCAALPYKEDQIQVAKKDTRFWTKGSHYQIKNPENSDGLTGNENQFTTSEYDWEDGNSFTKDEINKAWSDGGLAIVGIIPCSENNKFHLYEGSDSNEVNFTYNPVAQDNFGNWIKFVMGWDDSSKGGHHNRDWRINEVQLA